jgi:phenylacetate-CoA ligase
MFPRLPPWAVRAAVYPVLRYLKRDGLSARVDELRSHEHLSPDDLGEIQWRGLERFLKYVETYVPYYRDLFKEIGLSSEDVSNRNDLLGIPLLTKDRIRAAGRSMITEERTRKGVPLSTIGSTGEPLHFEVDTSAGPTRRACAIRSFGWMGIGIGDRQARIWGTYMNAPARVRIGERLRDYAANVLHLSAFDMSDQTMQDYASKLRAFKPDLLIGFPSALTLFAEFLKSRRVTGIRPKSILASGEKIFDHQKQILEEVFESRVFEGYGTNEFGNIAHECEERKGLHMFTDLFFLEILHETGRPVEPGETGEIVVTDLTNLYMPFLRYRTGDMAVLSERPCPCGRAFPLIERIEGRRFDVVVSPEGKAVGGFFWTFLSRAVPGIARFQVEQRDRSGVVFRVVPGPEWKDAYKAALEEKIKANLGDGFNVDFEIVNDIPRSRSGKFRFVVSRIEERLVVKSKIHKAHVTGEDPDKVDGIVIDGDLLRLADIVPLEKVLIVDNVNGARVETFARRGEEGKGEVRVTGAVARQVHAGDEIIIMSFTWSEQVEGRFKNILVDENNRFVRYLFEIAGDKA